MNAKPRALGHSYRIFTTGAFAVPVKVTINGVETWRWIVDSFEDDSFFDGEMCNPLEYAADRDELFGSLGDD